MTPMAAVSTLYTSDDKTKILTGEDVGSGLFTNRPIQSALANANLDMLFQLIKESPEFVGVVRAMIQDMMADGWTFEGSIGNQKRAEAFVNDSEFYRKMASALWDLRIAGDTQLIKLGAKPEAIDTFLNYRLSAAGFTKDFNTSSFKNFLKERIRSGNLRIKGAAVARTRDLQLVDTRTMAGVFDETAELQEWVQRVNGKVRYFKPEDVIHISIDNIGGNPYGFTPAHTLLKDIVTLVLAKDFASKVFENDNIPRGIFNFPKTNPDNNRDSEFLKAQLTELRKSKNKLRTLISTGEMNYIPLNNLAKDFEFRQLIQHFTTIIMFAWGVPAHRVPFLAENIRPQPKEANEGYYKGIAHEQKIIEGQLNKQLWQEFGVRMIFNKAYRIDELRQANIAAIVADRGLATTNEIRTKYLGLPERADGGALPVLSQNKPFTSFDQNRDNRVATGDDRDLMQPPADNQNNQLKGYDDD